MPEGESGRLYGQVRFTWVEQRSDNSCSLTECGLNYVQAAFRVATLPDHSPFGGAPGLALCVVRPRGTMPAQLLR